MHQEKKAHPKYTTEEIANHISNLGYDDHKSDLIASMITASVSAREPSQSPYITNTMVTLPSQKMGVAIVLESFGIEYARALQLEFDPEVLFYAAQPAELHASWPDTSGKTRRESFHPDFLVVSTDGVWFEETKPVDRLEKLISKPRQYWQKTDDGEFRYIPGEHNELGLDYRVVTDEQLSRTAIRNCEFLLHLNSTQVNEPGWLSESASRAIERVLLSEPSMTIDQLVEHAGVEHQDVHKAIILGRAHFINDHQLLADPAHCLVFGTMERAIACAEGRLRRGHISLRPGMTLTIGQQKFKVIDVHGTKMTVHGNDEFLNLDITKLLPEVLQSLEGQGQGTFSSLNVSDIPANDIEESLQRLRCLKAYEATKTLLTNPTTGQQYSLRTIRRWQKQRDEGVATGLSEFHSLVPNRANQGCRSKSNKGDPTPLIPAEVRELMDKTIKSYYLAPYQPSLQSTLGLINKEIAQKWPGMGREVCYSTLRARRNAIEKNSVVVAKRQGYRRGNVAKPAFGSISGELPMQGDYTFHVAEIDHTLADQVPVQIIDGERQPLNGKLMLSVMQDSYSRMPLAWHFTLDSEFGKDSSEVDKTTRASSARLSILLRKVLHRYGRLPTRVHVDGGSDFKSELLDGFLRAHNTVKSTRPPSSAKNGPLVERFFKAANEGLFHQLGGSRQLHGPRHLRDTTKSHMAEAHAQFTLEQLNKMLDKFMVEIYPNLEHTGINATPSQKFKQGLLKQPSFETITHDHKTLDLLLSIEVGTRDIGRDGVRFNNEHFSSPEISDQRKYLGKKVKIRVNPLDDSILFVLIDRRWIKLINKNNQARNFLAMEERLHASQENAVAKTASESRSYQQRKVGDQLPFNIQDVTGNALKLLAEDGDENIEAARDVG